MMLPLAILTLGAFAAGYLNWPERPQSLGGFLGFSPSFAQGYVAAAGITTVNPEVFGVHDARAVPAEHGIEVMLVSGFISAVGIFLAYVMHLRDRSRAERFANELPKTKWLLENKYFVDEVYRAAVVRPLWALGQAFFWIDRMLVDGLVSAMGWVPLQSGRALRLTIQRGYLQGYATAMLFGVAIILLIIFL
jgi:NADH-quinone oxidoreductase subunit L